MPRASIRVALALAALLIPAQTAGARVFQMSGHWTQDRGTMLGLDLPPMPPVPGAGVATATGSAPARLTLVPGRFSEMGGGVLQALPAPFVQLSTRVDAQGPIASAMFAPGPKPSRPASFTRVITDVPALSHAAYAALALSLLLVGYALRRRL